MKLFTNAFKDINYKAPEREFYYWLLLGVFIIPLGFWLDEQVFSYIINWQTPLLNTVIVFLTEYFIYALLALFGAATLFRVWHSPNNQSQLVPGCFAVLAAGIMAYVLKSYFAIPRPYLELALDPLVPGISYSFPSGHTAVAFALLIPLWRIHKWLGLSWLVFAITIGFARVYEFVHYPSDIAAGVILGGVVGAFFSHSESIKLFKVLWQELEFRRQSFHFACGFLCVFLHWAGALRLRFIGAILVIGLILSLASQYKKFPFLSKILSLFDRPRDHNFPGRGAFYFCLGVFLTFALFQKEHINIAYAAILILAVGDSLNHLFASQVYRYGLPWNRRKNVVGIIVGITMGTVASQFFVPFFPALIASTIAITAETVPWRIGKFYLDDNILVPLLAGGILWILV
jgi:undecaprenyl-diphosphatase